MTEHHVLLFLFQVLVVLGLARLFGELFRRFKQPPFAGEILAGLVLGKTALGAVAPALFEKLFPASEVQHAMFGVTAELGILFLLLVVGLEINLGAAWRMRARTLTVAVAGVLVPLAIGTAAAWLLFDQWVETETTRLAFSLLVGAGVAITAITVVARLLFDMQLIKSDLGLFLVSAMALNEFLGWLVLAMVLGFVGASDSTSLSLVGRMAGIIIFAVFAATLGRSLATRAFVWMKQSRLPSPAVPLSLVVCLGLGGGIVTQLLGVHPVFGFLLAGMLAGDPRALSEHARSVIAQIVESLFIPLFFAGICLHIDFASHFRWSTVGLILLLSVSGKYLGAWAGARMARIPIAERVPVAIAHIPGGPMGVLLASVGREAGVIGEEMFVALVVASVVSSLLVGPGFAWALRRGLRQDGPRAALFAKDLILCPLLARSVEEAIDVLARHAAGCQSAASAEEIRAAATAREHTMGTALGQGVAIPHARISDLKSPLVVVGISKEGIDWDAYDGYPTHLVFLVLSPAEQPESQLLALAAIARVTGDPEAQEALRSAGNADEAWQTLGRYRGASGL